jgi:hypothetical protein
MGRRKRFIDKKNATTYYLVHKGVEDDNDAIELQGDRELATAEDIAKRRVEVTKQAAAKHPLSFLFVDEDDIVQNEEHRAEILELGLPDDGYNYLKHIRAPVGTVSLVPPSSKASAKPLPELPGFKNEKDEGEFAVSCLDFVGDCLHTLVSICQIQCQ